MNLDGIRNERIKSGGINPRLSQRRSEVLLFLAREGPTNTYQISGGLSIQYSTAHSAVKTLEKQGFVRLESEEETEKGVTAKVYSLTLVGLAAAFTIKDLWSRVDDVAEKWRDLDPLLLGKWRHLTNTAPRAEAVEALQHAAKELYEKPFIDKENKRIADGGIVQNHLREEFFNRVFHPVLRFSTEKWIDAVRSEPTLNEWVTRFLQVTASALQARLYWAEEVQRGLRGEGFTGWNGYLKKLEAERAHHE